MDRSEIANLDTAAPRWWVILWMAWGLTLAVLSLQRTCGTLTAFGVVSGPARARKEQRN